MQPDIDPDFQRLKRAMRDTLQGCAEAAEIMATVLEGDPTVPAPIALRTLATVFRAELLRISGDAG